ncbi:hypothetical protein STANM309S_03415 [Streptomyces tanashiensis]
MLRVLLGHRLKGGQGDDVDVHDGVHGVAGADGLLEVVARVEEDHVHAGADPGGEVGDDRVLHGGGDAEAVAEGVHGPAEDLQRGGVLQITAGLLGECLQVGRGRVLSDRHMSSLPVVLPEVAGARSPRNFSWKARLHAAHSQAP